MPNGYTGLPPEGKFPTLRAFLRETGTSQRRLADDVGVTPSAINQILSGHKRPGPDVALQLAARTGVPLKAILQKPRRRPARARGGT